GQEGWRGIGYFGSNTVASAVVASASAATIAPSPGVILFLATGNRIRLDLRIVDRVIEQFLPAAPKTRIKKQTNSTKGIR
ncbi:MAG: hypothetical protein ACRD4E_03665, partial [Bryobacteraceae bacterium]